MSATDELRRMLDERGVKWRDDSSVYGTRRTVWTVDGVTYVAAEVSGRLKVSGYLTPEQAIAATLGRETCCDVRSADHTIAFECSECGCWVAYDEYWETGIYVLHETGQEHIHPRYCPNCGRRVEQ